MKNRTKEVHVKAPHCDLGLVNRVELGHSASFSFVKSRFEKKCPVTDPPFRCQGCTVDVHVGRNGHTYLRGDTVNDWPSCLHVRKKLL